MSDKPFQENNKYTQVHNYTFDSLMPVLTGTGFKVLCFIIRNTKGVTDNEGNRVKIAALSYSLIKKGTGIGSSATLSEGIKELVVFGLITITEGQEEYEANSYAINDNHIALSKNQLEILAKQYKQERKERSTKNEPSSETESASGSETEQPPSSETEHIKRKTTKEIKKTTVISEKPKAQRPPDPLFDAIKEVFGLLDGDRIGTIRTVMLGKSTNPRYASCNFDTPATGEEVLKFAKWYKSKYPKLSMPQDISKIHRHFHDFRKSGGSAIESRVLNGRYQEKLGGVWTDVWGAHNAQYD